MLNYFTSKAIITYFFLLFFCAILFSYNILPIAWIIFGVFTVLVFFILLNRFTKKWSDIPVKSFKSRLVKTSFLINIIWVLFSYLFFQINTDIPFEFDAGDSLSYHWVALRYSSFMYNDLNILWNLFVVIPYSDTGFFFYLSVVYFLFFQSILIPRILNAFYSSICLLLVYKLANRNFGEKVARTAAILAMLLPNLIYYNGLHLKETLMLLILISFMERADFILRTNKISFINIIWLVLLGLSLFLFRTVLGVSAFFAFFCALLFSGVNKVKISSRMFVGIVSALLVIIALSQKVIIEVIENWQDKATNQTTSFQDLGKVNKFAVLGSFAVFAPIILITPLPTMVNISTQANQMMLNGAYFTRNVYAFFVIFALISIVKQKQIKKNLLIISFVFIYLTIIAMSGFALSERFHLPAVPFLLILASYGINKINKSTKRYYIIYLLVVSVLIIAWNWFKLAGRDLE